MKYRNIKYWYFSMEDLCFNSHLVKNENNEQPCSSAVRLQIIEISNAFCIKLFQLQSVTCYKLY